MPGANGYSWGLKLLAFLFALVVAAVGAPIWIEARIGASVTAEAIERKAADIAIEQRQEKRMERIEGKLDNIEKYIRGQ
jgi:predicted lysophospholipase L1 biosynthesis ABC-type transport system permease subunit